MSRAGAGPVKEAPWLGEATAAASTPGAAECAAACVVPTPSPAGCAGIGALRKSWADDCAATGWATGCAATDCPAELIVAKWLVFIPLATLKTSINTTQALWPGCGCATWSWAAVAAREGGTTTQECRGRGVYVDTEAESLSRMARTHSPKREEIKQYVTRQTPGA